MDVANTNNKIEALQVLRAIAFLGIFLSHADIIFSWSKLSVSVFFVLSGFLLSYKYYDWDEKYGVCDSVRFSFHRIKKLYRLHIVTMILTLIPLILFKIESLPSLAVKTILNVFLLQTWVPIIAINISLNGVAWFLSVMAFQYFCFPIIAHWLKGIYNTKKLILFSIAIWVLTLLTALSLVNFPGIDGHFFTYLTKICPLFRLGDFSIGCIWGRILKINENRNKNNHRTNRLIATVNECVIFTAVIIIVIIGKLPHTTVIMKWIWNPTSLYLICSVMLVVMFFLKKGVITNWIAEKKLFVYLGDNSGEMFLIHYVVIFYFQSIQNRLLNDSIQLNLCYKFFIMVIELFITIIYTRLWKYIVKRLAA